MISCDLVGGLGNQLFILFATISCAISNKHPFYFLYSDITTGRKTYWNTFLTSLKIFTCTQLQISDSPKNIIRENGFHYQPILESISKNNTILYGYYQSYKYFEKNYTSICKLIRLDEHKIKIKQKYLYDYANLTSMHFRLGDYKALPEYHLILPIEYYKKCIQDIEKKQKGKQQSILYFCEKEDNKIVDRIIIELLKEFPECEFFKADVEIDDWEQMLMMSLCCNNIIANSTFSWWAAYFNSYIDKTVYYPNIWFGPRLAHYNLTDLFPESWIKIIV
jgi:hypothetical protein